MIRWCSLPILLAIAAPLRADDLRVFPPSMNLQSPNGTQRLVVVTEEKGQSTQFHPVGIQYRSTNTHVATITSEGIVTAVAPGTTTVTATIGDRAASATVTVTGPMKPGQWSFTRHVIPTLTRSGCNSGACHGALAGKGGFKLSLRGFDPDADWFAMTRQASARRVDTAEPVASLLLKKALRQIPHGGGTRFADDSIYFKVFSDWITNGAKGPNTGDAVPVSIDLFPKSILGTPHSKARLIVVARYADGHTEDVTQWAKFVSSEEQVAAVDEDGVVTVAGSGVSGLSVVYGTSVATATVTVPYANRVEPSAFAKRPGQSFIDGHILDKLAELNLPPSPQATDHEFVRRAFLDVCGILPTPDELQEYITDKSPDKRARLIDNLLNRKEYVDYWTYRWSDLFLVSTRELPQAATWAFYRSLRQAVADNQPWDRVARQILTASGSTLQNGYANYFMLHKDPAKLAETTALTFLGTSIGCAKCHNHPLEKWTQDEYWAFANLFSRVAIKNGDAGENIVSSSPHGNALHLRRGTAMPPAPLGGTAIPLDSPLDRRKAFADWLTAKKNPFFTKAIVNRIWKAYMGRGLVEAEDDLRATNPPSNPALFDALAADFIANGYDVKKLMRQILTSDAYARSSRPTKENTADDRFYSRYFVRRLPAEVILDAYSAITNVPTPFDEASAGPSNGTVKKTDYPSGTRAVQLPDTLLLSPFLDQFGRPERLQTCACERTADSSVSQALHVSNGKTLNDKLRNDHSIVRQWLADKLDDHEVIRRAFVLTLGRPPTVAERAKYFDVLKSVESPLAKRETIEDLLWALLTGREFLFNH